MTRVTGKASPGTLLYMSPEQVNGEDPCKTWDVYSLAASLYELVSGKPPFHSGDIGYQIHNKSPKSLKAGGVDITDKAEEAILSGLAKTADKRPASCGEFVRQFRDAEKVPVRAQLSKPYEASESFHPGRVLPKNLDIELGGGVKLELVLISAGKFLMGSPKTELGSKENEIQHEVTITKPFYIGKYPVTQAQYQIVMGNNPSYFQSEKVGNLNHLHPIETVSWDNASEFCNRLSTLPNARNRVGLYRLPTEAEWEYACRAGSTTAFSFGINPSGLSDFGWFDENSENVTHPVGQKKPNVWGLYDMHGNVWEWCNDYYGEYSKVAVKDPTGPSQGSYRVFRGGSWNFEAAFCRSAYRIRLEPFNRDSDVGFRVVLSTS
jgi:formylglycine-generating enzyme required for sulfatase activity